MEKYDPKKIESKWQQYWEEHLEIFSARNASYAGGEAREYATEEKKFILDMFPYPSGAGLHVGHVESYTATDIFSRYLRMNGKNVLHPQGWDAFGLPAENYAIKTGTHPKITTQKAIANFKNQMKKMGFSYDWSRELNSSDPEYYRWTQWFFLLLYKNGLAYKAKAKVNWCDSCQTVLANEQAEGGICERCKNQVIQKDLEQWFFRITDFIENNRETSGLISGLDKVDWPESTKTAQKNWIGKSDGIELRYDVEGLDEKVVVYTTRPDTNFGATFIVMAPDSDFVKRYVESFPNKDESKKYIEETLKKGQLDRIIGSRKKTGVFTGLYAINKLNERKMPIYISDFVLATVGTGSVVGVPGHDIRDFEFAEAMGIDIIRVVKGKDGDISPISKAEQVQEEEGIMINSGFLDGMDIHEAKEKIKDHIEQQGWGTRSKNYRLKDWLVSRQRYWGAPIPIIYCDKCGMVPVPEDDLPVMLPDDVDFKPTGESPLLYSKKFHEVKCPQCGKEARRESDTMDTFVCSSWYYFRYADPKNSSAFADKEKIKKWLPVDLYVGGAEHSVLHLLYSRFFTKVLHKLGYIDFDEPFSKLRHQGIILAEDGRKMSKSLGNVINPDDVVAEYGADTLRLFEMFMGPLEDMKPWNTKSIMGARRFLERIWDFYQNFLNNFDKVRDWTGTREDEIMLNKTVKKVTEDIESMKFNTVISELMKYLNYMTGRKRDDGGMDTFNITHALTFAKLLYPLAPHISSELFQQIQHADKEKSGHDNIALESWPAYDAAMIAEEEIELVIQINGKLRDRIKARADISEADAKDLALGSDKIKNFLAQKEVRRVVFIGGRLINIVV